MTSIIAKINKAFENRVRLGIMSALAVNDYQDFTTLKKLLDITDGNLSSNIAVLEKLKFIKVKKKFINKKSNTSFYITNAGYTAFKEHINAIEKLIKTVK